MVAGDGRQEPPADSRRPEPLSKRTLQLSSDQTKVNKMLIDQTIAMTKEIKNLKKLIAYPANQMNSAMRALSNVVIGKVQ